MPDAVRTRLSGLDLIRNPLLNKGTAFTDAERTAFALHGLLPPHIGTLDEQVARRLKALRSQPAAFQQYSFLRDLQDSNETLFYALLTRNIEEIMPLVYTPTVGEGCQRFSEIWRKPRGLFLSYPNRHRIREILAHPRYDEVRVIVVSDGERILGLGDQGRMGSVGHIPQPDGAIRDACGERLAVGAERHGPDVAGRPGQRRADLHRMRRVGHVPQPYRLVRAADGEQPGIGAERQADGVAGRPGQWLAEWDRTGGVGDVP